jgi:hypothetical protein
MSTSSLSAKKSEANILKAVLTIRELLLDYYKGKVTQPLAERNNIRVVYEQRTYPTGRPNRYERERFANRKEGQLYVGDQPIMSLSKNDVAEVKIYDDILLRSPQLTAIKIEVDRFLNTYLQSIPVKRRNAAGRRESGVNDDKLIAKAIEERSGNSWNNERVYNGDSMEQMVRDYNEYIVRMRPNF